MRKFYDKNGDRITEFAVLKFFHFIGARRKKHYMYKWVRYDDNGDLMAKHLTSADDAVRLYALADSSGVIKGAEIVQDGADLDVFEQQDL